MAIQIIIHSIIYTQCDNKIITKSIHMNENANKKETKNAENESKINKLIKKRLTQ